ncbi:hypothetical protein J6590_014791 [Homalodisca vitripennis]|nr:hypothetical protein J6590_014791 [Homalodisca vitripennis]
MRVSVQFCLNCGRKYSSLRSLVRHQRYECGKLPQFACPLCSYKAHQKVSLKKHIASRHTQQWFGLQSSGALEILGQDDDIRHPCVTCGRSYKRKSHLNFHRRYECNKDPKFFCPFCPYRAKQKSAWKVHVLRHHEAYSADAQ